MAKDLNYSCKSTRAIRFIFGKAMNRFIPSPLNQIVLGLLFFSNVGFDIK